MNCPVCKTVTLTMAERQGIEIDYCPQCRGVWLDRGELDKLIDRAAPSASQAAQPKYREEPGERESFRNDNRPGYRKKKREGFLGELFDFD